MNLTKIIIHNILSTLLLIILLTYIYFQDIIYLFCRSCTKAIYIESKKYTHVYKT